MDVGASIYAVAETMIGRKRMWRLARQMYLMARRDGSLDFEADGELEVISRLAQWSRTAGRPLTVLDVGANEGVWTQALLDALEAVAAPRGARLTAFEPVPALAENLRRLAAADDGAPRFRVVQCALSNREGAMPFVVTEGGGDHHLAARDFGFAGRTIETPVSTLDAWCAAEGVDRVDFVKIDAEGFDPLVIAGAARMLEAEKIMAIQFEYGSPYIRSRTYLYDIFEQINPLPYQIGRVTKQSIELFDRWHFDMERFYGSNYIIVHQSAREWMGCRTVSYDITNAYE
jgi:FkbM family methyltransferase